MRRDRANRTKQTGWASHEAGAALVTCPGPLGPLREEGVEPLIGLGFHLKLSLRQLRCLVTTGPVHVLCPPPALSSRGVHVPSSLPSLRSVSTATSSRKPLLTAHLSGSPPVSTVLSSPELWSPSAMNFCP